MAGRVPSPHRAPRPPAARGAFLGALLAIALLAPAALAAPDDGTGYKGEYARYREAVAQKDISKAMRHARRAYQLAREELEPGSETLAVLAFNLGALYYELDRFRDAAGVLEQAVRLYVAAHGEHAEAVLAPTLKLARTLERLEQWADAERRYVAAIDIIESHRGRHDEQLADILARLIHVAAALEQPKRVRSYGLRALGIHAGLHGEDHLDSAWIHLDLARNELEYGDYLTARKHVQAALPVIEARLAPRDPRLADTYRFLAQFYEAAGKGQTARSYRKKAIAIAEADATGE